MDTENAEECVEKRMTTSMIEDIIHSLVMRINHVETGTTTHSAIDAAAFNKALNPKSMLDRHRVIAINPLSREQRSLIARLEDSISLLRTELNIRANAKHYPPKRRQKN